MKKISLIFIISFIILGASGSYGYFLYVYEYNTSSSEEALAPELIGEEQNISPIINKNLELHYLGYGEKSPNFEEDDKGSLVLKVKLKNNSALPYKLLYNGDYTFMSQSNLIEIPPYDNLILRVKTIKKKDKIELYFKVLNAIIGPQKNLDIILSHDWYYLN